MTIKKRYLILMVFLITGVPAGCASFSNLEAGNTSMSENEGIIILGVKQEYRLGIKLVRSNEFEYLDNREIPVAANITPDNSGYIITMLPKTDVYYSYAITQLLPDGITGSRYGPCGSSKTATFKVKPGQVTYVGDIDYGNDPDKPKAQYSFDKARAIKYIKQQYPSLGGKVVDGSISVLKVRNNPCDVNYIFLPIR